MAISPLAFTGITAAQQFGNVGADGWIAVNDNWRMLNVAPTDYYEMQIQVNAGAADRYWIGEKIAFTVTEYGTTVFYGYISGISDTKIYFRGNDTTATILYDSGSEAYLSDGTTLKGHCENILISNSSNPANFPSYLTCAPPLKGFVSDPTSTGTGRFTLSGTLLNFQGAWATSGGGSGTYYFVAPMMSTDLSTYTCGGSGFLDHDASRILTIPAVYSASPTAITFWFNNNAATYDQIVGHNTPWTWDADDDIGIWVTYFIDDTRTVP